jgi:hypothetical protein
MVLTKKDVRLLRLYQKYRQRTPTVLALRPRLRWLLGVFAVAAPFSLLATTDGGVVRFRWWLCGFLLGAVFVRGSAIVSTIWNWWLTREIINWDRVDKLVSEYEGRAIQPGASPNGGPATPLGNSAAAEGPPSVS